MRTLLGVLRVDTEPELEPAHGLADLRTLADRVTAAGVAVTLEFSRTPAVILPRLDLAAYRVIQEAVTNVIKHSGAGRCRVGVTHEADALTVEITDDGRGTTQSKGGHGLEGMRERVSMYGGTFEAGPRPAGGSGVTARFPT
jgi:signal transduction histidine kinase